MKQIVKILVIIVLTFIIAQTSHAQISPRNVQELMSYFDDNIQHLDPIEGVYDVNIEQWGENAYQQFPSETTNIMMLIYKDKDGLFRVFKNDQVTIKKIGATPIYNYNLFWAGSNVTDSKRFVLEGNSIFNVKYSIPDKQLRYDLGRKYQAGFKVNFKCSFVKTYPTPDMYADNEVMGESEVDKMTEWSGTGFALKNGYIVTNYHVIDGANTITVQGVKGNFNNSYKATVVGTDKNNDLALLKISDSSFPGFGAIPYSISSATSEVGEDIFVLGYPLTSTMGDEIKLTTGVISSKTGFQGDVALYQISAPIQPGNSGGPLFDKKGNVIGVVSAKHAGTENVGYAIKSMYLRNLIESAVNSTIIPTTNTVSTLPLTGKVKSEKNFVFMISCSSKANYNSTYSTSTGLNGNLGSVTINNPSVTSSTTSRLHITKVIANEKETMVEFRGNNNSLTGYYTWVTISPYTYIMANGKRYTLKRSEGIAIDPKKTYFNHPNTDYTFKLIFPSIPPNVSSFDLIESQESEWKFYGVRIR